MKKHWLLSLLLLVGAVAQSYQLAAEQEDSDISEEIYELELADLIGDGEESGPPVWS